MYYPLTVLLFAVVTAQAGFASNSFPTDSTSGKITAVPLGEREIGVDNKEEIYSSVLHGAQTKDINAIVEKSAKEWISENVLSSSRATRFLNDGPTSLRRSLSSGDFDELNALFEGTVVGLPNPPKIQKKIMFINLDLYLTDIRCFSINVQDIVLSYTMDSNQNLSLRIDIIGLDLDCDTKWRFDWGLVHESGTAQFRSDDNTIATVIGFTSEDFSKHPPNGSTVDSCSSAINISDINIFGGFMADIVNLFEGLLRGPVAEEIEVVACDEIGSLGRKTMSDIMALVAEKVDGYLGELPYEISKPLYAEETLKVPGNVKLLDLKQSDAIIGAWFNSAMKQAVELFGSTTDDPNSPSGTGKDLGINKILRGK